MPNYSQPSRGYQSTTYQSPVANRPAVNIPAPRYYGSSQPQQPSPMMRTANPYQSKPSVAYGRDPMAYNRMVGGYKNGGSSNKKCNEKW